MRNIQISRFGRVVKATDLKSVGFARAGSNPAADDFLLRLITTKFSMRALVFFAFCFFTRNPYRT